VLALFDGKLARYKLPKGVMFVETLPRNAMGKILKNDIREMVKE
jgi:acyl-CoA synthetase (AMP-forming)/AMP-acid ligase II